MFGARQAAYESFAHLVRRRFGQRLGKFVIDQADLRKLAPAAVAGCLALATGLLVYLVDRDLSRSVLIPAAAALAHPPIFGVLGQWLPSFVHPFAFSLFTSAALAPSRAPRYLVCIAWGAVNVAFELGQHPLASTRLAELLHAGFGHRPVVDALANYFVHGTFDPWDIMAAILGVVAAAMFLRLTHAIPGGIA